ncbi:MAG TPA: MBL fold metallo-hydrolase [Armatimonadota bacterium]|jgi:phosphoribosyl 1,2-cyclic phosphate phosphodiesterase
MPNHTLTFLGTSAGELYPGIWCRCQTCQRARELGGPNLRAQTCAYVSPGIMLDFPADVLATAARWGVPLPEVSWILVTHSHEDHLFPYHFQWRRLSGPATHTPPLDRIAPRFTPLPLMTVAGSAVACERTRVYVTEGEKPYALVTRVVEPGDVFNAAGVQVTALRANHQVPGETTLNYLLEADGRSLAYLLDTDVLLEETWEALKCRQLNVVILEATFGRAYCPGSNHMDFRKLRETRARMVGEGLLAPGCRFIATHFSPHHTPPHDETAAELAEFGVEASCDGFTVEW